MGAMKGGYEGGGSLNYKLPCRRVVRVYMIIGYITYDHWH